MFEKVFHARFNVDLLLNISRTDMVRIFDPAIDEIVALVERQIERGKRGEHQVPKVRIFSDFGDIAVCLISVGGFLGWRFWAIAIPSPTSEKEARQHRNRCSNPVL